MRDGSLYLLVGPPGSGNVWRLDLAAKSARQLTHNNNQDGVSWIAASPAGLVLADAATGVDVVSVYKGNKSQPLAGHGGTPAISPSGQVAFIEVPDVVGNTGPQQWRIAVVTAPGQTPETYYEQPGPDMGALAWGPQNQLAVISAPGPRADPTTSAEPNVANSASPAGSPAAASAAPAVLILDAHGKIESRITPSFAAIGFLAWSPAAPALAVGGITGQSELVDVSNGHTTALPAGWTPECWSPDGQSLVVTRGNDLGVVRIASPHSVHTVETMTPDAPVTGCSWLSVPAASA